eukprot:scaffold665_cov341-Prasinococcus_capsulatus_cf.AAC.4
MRRSSAARSPSTLTSSRTRPPAAAPLLAPARGPGAGASQEATAAAPAVASRAAGASERGAAFRPFLSWRPRRRRRTARASCTRCSPRRRPAPAGPPRELAVAAGPPCQPCNTLAYTVGQGPRRRWL